MMTDFDAAVSRLGDQVAAKIISPYMFTPIVV